VPVGDRAWAAAERGAVAPRHFRPFGAGVVRHRHVDHLLAGVLGGTDLGNAALVALAVRGVGIPGHGRLPPQVMSVSAIRASTSARPAKSKRPWRPLTKLSGSGCKASGAASSMAPPPSVVA